MILFYNASSRSVADFCKTNRFCFLCCFFGWGWDEGCGGGWVGGLFEGEGGGFFMHYICTDLRSSVLAILSQSTCQFVSFLLSELILFPISL